MQTPHIDFAVDLKKIEPIGSLHPDSIDALDAFNRHGLSSEERLYYQLVSDLALETAVYKPGTVLGLAAGLANHPHNMSATALTTVTASVIPNKVFKAIDSCHPGLRGINRNTVMRILNLSSIPESLK
jgi:CRP-like cAMP-binding protein